MHEVNLKQIRSYTMSRIRSKDTKPEITVRKFLHANGFRFKLHVKNLPGKPDIVLPKYNVVVNVMGCFWHGHTECKTWKMPKSHQDYWIPKIRRNIERDKSNSTELFELGWRELKIWECQLKKSPEITLALVMDQIKNCTNQ
jgi:DNA mismatch endonuclease (patch repair protein)